MSLKLLVAQLIEERGWDGRTIAYLTFDTVRTLAQAEATLREATGDRGVRLLIVDEVTALTGWQRVVKKLRDDGTLTRLCVLLTGSSSHDLKTGSERLAGRRGPLQLPDRILLPMTFPMFLDQLARAGKPIRPSEAIRAYLEVGGFPFRVESYLQALRRGGRHDPAEGLQVFDDVVFYEFIRRRLDRSIALEVLGRLASVSTTAVSYESFAKGITASRDTARKYLDVLGDAFLLATLSSYDTGRGRVAPKKNRRFIWIDPAFGYLAPWLRQGEAAPEAARAEWVVGAALLKEFEERLWEGLSSPRNVFTWRSKAGNEIDYLIVDRSRRLVFPVEVKYQRSITDWDFQVMERAFGKGLMVTPEIDRERSKSRAVSLAVFLRDTGQLVG